MELQWPLILFTAFIAWSAGLFGALSIYQLRGKALKAQLPALIASVVIMAIGGICVFFHLQHWERMFNGFGHITSGITQELIGIIVMAVLMVLYFFMMRRSGDNTVPKPLSIANIVVAVALVCVMGHSYMMASLPMWDTVMQIASLVGSACALGPASMALIASICGNEDEDAHGLINIIGQAANVVLAVGYLIAMALESSAFTAVSYWFDPTSPTRDITESVGLSPFAGDTLPLAVIVVVLAVLGVVTAIIGKQKGHWKIWGTAGIVCALASAMCLRVVFYMLGVSVYPFF